MPISNRGQTSHSTYFVTSSTFGKRQPLQDPKYARLLLDCIEGHRQKQRFDLHAYVIMLDHFHLIVTPAVDLTLEKVMQFIKGGFSFRIKKEHGFFGEVWQTSFYDRRVRDFEEYQRLRDYVHSNPARRGLPEDYECTSVRRCDLDPLPQRLKPDGVAML